MQTIVAILLVGFFGALCWSLLRPPAQFVIRCSRGSVRFSGKFPRSRQSETKEFLQREFADRRRITVAGIQAGPAGLRIVVRGSITNGDRQRIRNIFHTLR